MFSSIHLQVVVFSWLVFGFSLVSPFISLDVDHISMVFVFFYACALFLFYLGYCVGLRSNVTRFVSMRVRSAIRMFFVVLFCALVFEVVDFFLIRTPADVFSVASVREAKTSGSNLFSVFGAFLVPLSILTFVKLADADHVQFDLSQKVLISLAFSVFLFSTFMVGSRGIFLTMLIVLFGGGLSKLRILLIAPVVALGAGIGFVYRFISLNSVDGLVEVFGAVSGRGYSEFVPVTRYALEAIDHVYLKFVYFSVVQANQYLAHGFFEFAYIFSKAPSFSFDPSKLIPHLGRLFETSSSWDRPNLYYTAVGSWYLAFGAFCLAAAPFLGMMLGAMYKMALLIGPGPRNLILYALFLTPYVNNIGSYDLHFFYFSIFVVSRIKILEK